MILKFYLLRLLGINPAAVIFLSGSDIKFCNLFLYG